MTTIERYTGYTPGKVLSSLDGLPQPTPDHQEPPRTEERHFTVTFPKGWIITPNGDGTHHVTCPGSWDQVNGDVLKACEALDEHVHGALLDEAEEEVL